MTHDERVKLAVQLAAGMLADQTWRTTEHIADSAWTILEAIEAEGEKRRKAEDPVKRFMDEELERAERELENIAKRGLALQP